MIKVWDLWVRIGHWLLVITVGAAWWTRHGNEWHSWMGYTASALIAVRLLWGFIGSRHARFADFVRVPRTVAQYAGDLLHRREAHFLGHNPLGGYMVMALLLTVALTGLSGWLYTTDRYWGVEWVGETHEFLSNALLGLIGVHVIGVLFASVRERANLIAAMIHGKKRAH